MDRHPRMVVVMAHMMNLFCTDEQLDVLAYVLERYPNLHVEIGGRFGEFGNMQREHLRNFMIRYADRILFGTDVTGPAILRDTDNRTVAGYLRAFQLLETDEVVQGGFFNDQGPAHRGLALPPEVLEKIYYQNAVRIYPRLKTVLN
jgi:predicted TIM-barrel fold metal-dependent hydrolase